MENRGYQPQQGPGPGGTPPVGALERTGPRDAAVPRLLAVTHAGRASFLGGSGAAGEQAASQAADRSHCPAASPASREIKTAATEDRGSGGRPGAAPGVKRG